MGSKKIYICRHGLSKANAAGIVQAQSGGELTDIGKEQALERGRSLADRDIELILCGDLKRHVQTADSISVHVKAPMIITPLLQERGMGDLEGRSYSEQELGPPDGFIYYGKDGEGIFSELESLESVTERAYQVTDIIRSSPQENILVVSSGWMNSYLVNILLNESWRCYAQDNCALHRVFIGRDGECYHHDINLNTIRRDSTLNLKKEH